MKIKKQRVGVIGWLCAIDNEFGKTTAICDIRPDSLENFQTNNPQLKVKAYTDYRKMADDGEIDVVYIATPNQFHREMTEYFLKKGVHVFLEKPMGNNREELDSIFKTQQKSGKHVGIDFELRIDGFSKRAKEIIDSGEIGKPVGVQLIHHRGGWLADQRTWWKADPKLSGGLFFNELCHGVDLFRFWFGEITAVQSFSFPNVLPQYLDGMPDNACTHFWFENGMKGTMLSNHATSVYNAKSGHYEELGHDLKYLIVGTKGTIRIDIIKYQFLICKFTEYHPKGDRGVRVELNRIEDYSGGSHVDFHHNTMGNLNLFVEHMAKGIPPHQDAADARISHLIGLAAEQSAKENSQKISCNFK